MGKKDYDGQTFTMTWYKDRQRNPVPQSYLDSYKKNTYFIVDGMKFYFSQGLNKSMHVKVFSKYNIFLNIGFAFLHPQDIFVPFIGAGLALTNVLPELNLAREQEAKIWRKFFEIFGESIMSKNV